MPSEVICLQLLTYLLQAQVSMRLEDELDDHVRSKSGFALGRSRGSCQLVSLRNLLTRRTRRRLKSQASGPSSSPVDCASIFPR